MQPKPSPPELAEVLSDAERARRELAKLGVTWATGRLVDERIYALLLSLPPKLRRPCNVADLHEALTAEGFQIKKYNIQDSLSRLRDAGRVLNPIRQVWVAVTE
jgi:hypothetical protein